MDRMKISIIIPVYYNEENLIPLYNELSEKVLNNNDVDFELIFVDDGSQDTSYDIISGLSKEDNCVKAIKLSRNFGSHAAILCGLEKCTGDCAIVKAADMQEPTELIFDMIDSWKKGNNVVLAIRKERNDGFGNNLFANFYYWIVRRTALPNMPKGGYDIYLLDRKVITVIKNLDEKNSALTGQILWSGFRTGEVEYSRKKREIGSSKWTIRKKVKLVMDTLFSFSTLPITFVSIVGFLSFLGSVIWAIIVAGLKISGAIDVEGWTMLFIFSLFSFGVIMLTLGILGEYLWRAFDASRNRPIYIVEEENIL